MSIVSLDKTPCNYTTEEQGNKKREKAESCMTNQEPEPGAGLEGIWGPDPTLLQVTMFLFLYLSVFCTLRPVLSRDCNFWFLRISWWLALCFDVSKKWLKRRMAGWTNLQDSIWSLHGRMNPEVLLDMTCNIQVQLPLRITFMQEQIDQKWDK